MKKSVNQGQAGFTLLETLIAMTLLAVLMLALSGSIGFVGRTWDKGWRASERSDALAQTEGMLRQLLERSFPAVIDVQKKQRFAFEGHTDSLRMVSYETVGIAPVGYRLSEIATSPGADRHLVFRQQSFATLPGEVEEAILPAKNATLAFAYFGTLQPSTQPTWYKEWNSDRRLPDLIRIDVLNDAIRIWPTILIRPQVTAEYACIAATFPGICRGSGEAP